MSPFILGFTIKTYLTETVLLIYKTVTIKHNFQTKKKSLSVLQLKIFDIEIFKTPNSKTTFTTLHKVTKVKLGFFFLLML